MTRKTVVTCKTQPLGIYMHTTAKEHVVVEIDPPEAIVERARQRAGDTGCIDEHLLDCYLFEYEWLGVEESKNE